MANKDDKPAEPEPTPPSVPEPLSNIYCSISAVKIKDGETPTLQFTVNIPLGTDYSNMVRVAQIQRAGGYITLTPAKHQIPLPETEPESLPMDGDVTGDPFPAWDRLFDAAEMPLCECPVADRSQMSENEASRYADLYPAVAVAMSDDGTTVLISHMDPCKLPSVTISTADFTQTEDFNRAVVKAKGLKPQPPAGDTSVHLDHCAGKFADRAKACDAFTAPEGLCAFCKTLDDVTQYGKGFVETDALDFGNAPERE